jgi:hypothetical protein
MDAEQIHPLEGTMSRKPLTLAASLVAAAALAAPAAALAGDVHLGGAPTARMTDAHHATVRFASDRLPRTAKGKLDARVFFSGERATHLKAVGHHGRDVVYTARVSTDRTLRAGTKYTVKFKIADQDQIVRKVKLRPAS